eukprot:354616-Chlamydomonas_euryale.AAC.5
MFVGGFRLYGSLYGRCHVLYGKPLLIPDKLQKAAHFYPDALTCPLALSAAGVCYSRGSIGTFRRVSQIVTSSSSASLVWMLGWPYPDLGGHKVPSTRLGPDKVQASDGGVFPLRMWDSYPLRISGYPWISADMGADSDMN